MTNAFGIYSASTNLSVSFARLPYGTWLVRPDASSTELEHPSINLEQGHTIVEAKVISHESL
jgi:hypothetical protein